MKKIITTLLSLALVIGMCPIMASADDATPAWDGTVAESFAGGTGTQGDPYQIETAAQLKLATDTVNSSHKARYFVLKNDIDYENHQWTPIGYSTTTNSIYFTGGFDGGKHVVRNLKIDYNYVEGSPAFVYCGFFGFAKDVTITDLGIENFRVNVANPSTGDYRVKYFGGFAGALRGAVNVSGCFVKNATLRQTNRWNGESYGIGGFVGFIQPESGKNLNISDCYVYDVEYCAAVQRAMCGFVAAVTNINGGNFTNCYAANFTANYGSDTSLYSTTYGFGNTYSSSRQPGSVVNCYSTLTSGKGGYSSPAAYSTDQEFGVAGASLDTIDTNFKNLENWQDGTYINGGFPALAWEKAPIVVKDFADGKVTLEVNKAVAGAKVYVATYEDGTGRLIGADVANVAAGEIPVNVTTEGAATVKVFVWDTNLNPVAAMLSKPL